MSVIISELLTEIQTDPMTLGLAGMDDGGISRLLNAIGGSSETIEVTSLDAATVQRAVIGSEFINLSTAQQNLWLAILSVGTIAVKDPNIRAQVVAVWGAPTVTRTNLIALQSRSASRSEVLWGEGVSVSVSDVAIALRG